MIEHSSAAIRIRHPTLGWESHHAVDRFGGPVGFALDGELLVAGCHTYLDDLEDASLVLEEVRTSHRGGATVVGSTGYFPFGNEVRLTQTCRYAANHLQVTLDVVWPRATVLRQRLGVGSLFLPGAWSRFLVLPTLLEDGTEVGRGREWQPVPTAVGGSPHLVAEWMHPPLALILERTDGTRIETGTGDDLWRWQRRPGPVGVHGRYRLLAETDGVRYVREPFACESEAAVEAMTYRFSWYLAWARPRAGAPAPAATTGARELVPAAVPAGTAKLALRDGTATGAGEEPPFSLDLSRLDWPPAWCRRSPGLAGATAGGQPPCWQTPGVQKTARRLVRQLAGWRRHGRLLVCLPEPGVCLDATHLDRPPQRVLPHWDLPAMLEFAVWARRQLGPGWQLTAGLAPGVWRLLPSLQGAFEVSDSDIGE